MACQRFSALPSSSAILGGDEIAPITDTSNVDRKAKTAAIAQSATAYNSAHQYVQGYYVRASNGNIYRAVQNNTGQTPINNTAYWKPVLILSATTLNVPSDYASINTAMSYLSDAVLTATVTIQVADGNYALTTGQIILNHPYGQFIQLLGNTTTPASVGLSFTALPSPPTAPYINNDSGSIYVSNGFTFGLIDGFSITKAGGAPVFGHSGLLASSGANLNIGSNMTISGFWSQVSAYNAQVLVAGTSLTAPTFTTVASGYGLWTSGGYIQSPYAIINGVGDAVSANNNGSVFINSAAIASTVGIAVVLDNGAVFLPLATIGDTDEFYEISGGQNLIRDNGASYGTASVGEMVLLGSVVYNAAVVASNGETFDLSLIDANTIQRVVSSTESVYLSQFGVGTVGLSLELSAAGNLGAVIDSANGNVIVQTGLGVLSTDVFTGFQAGKGALDAAGVLTVAASYITANSVVVPAFTDATATGPTLGVVITAGVGFTLTSAAGIADATKTVAWQLTVYP